MAYWSSYDTTENSSSDVQWTVIVSYEAVHNSSRITGGFGAAIGKQKKNNESCARIMHKTTENRKAK